MPFSTPHRRWRRRRVFSSDDARELARLNLPRMIFDFIDGAAGRETAPARNTAAFAKVLLQPRVLLNVSQRSLKRRLLGKTFDVPFGVAPMGMCGLSHPQADNYLAQAAVARNLPVCLSSAASMTLEEMRRRAGGNAWFQLYASPSLERTLDLVSRAANAGYETLVLTVDVPQVSRRIRDLRNGFQVPFHLGMRQILDFAVHPRWSLSTLYHGVPRMANFDAASGNAFDRTGSRAAADWHFLDKLRALWKGNLVVKGVTSTDDAQRIQSAGADAIWVSNHGGRQLDSAPASIAVLPEIRAAVGPGTALLMDSGVRYGEDVVKALALGADLVMLGRPLLFAMGADGQRGLNDLLDELSEQISFAMAQIGVCTLDEISRHNLVAEAAALDELSAEPVKVVGGNMGVAK